MAGFPEILRIAKKIGLLDILKKHLPMEYDKNIRNPELLMSAIGVRICNPSSILGSIETIRQSSIPKILGFNSEEINEDMFYKRFKKVKADTIAEIQQEVFDSIKKHYEIDLSILDWDTSFVHVTGSKNELARKGMNQSNKFEPYGVKVALLQARNKIPLPLFFRVKEGNTSDVEMLRTDMERIKQLKGSLLVIDRFAKGFKDIKELKDSGVDVLCGDRTTDKLIREIGSLQFSQIKVDGMEMKHAMQIIEKEDLKLYRHVFIDPVKAERDKAKREKRKEKQKDFEKIVSGCQKNLGKSLKSVGIKANVKINVSDIEYEKTENKNIDGLVVLLSTKEMNPEDVIKTYRQHAWIEKGIKELKQFHQLRPMYVRNARMVDMLMLISFFAYLLMCLFRIEHESFKNSSDGTISEMLNAPCILLENGEKTIILISDGMANFFGKFVDIYPKQLKLNEMITQSISVLLDS